MKKTVLITGASSGFGKETTRHFRQNGWNVVATMRSPEKEEELSLLLDVLVTKLDVQDPSSIDSAVKAAIEKFGRIDALINNAGYGLMGVFESATHQQIRNQYEVNVFGLMNVTKAVLPYMRENGSGVIVNISSFGGIIGLPFGSLYNSSKFAVEGFSEALSHELMPLNIMVKIVEPGGVHTNFRNGLDVIKNEIPVYNSYMAGFFSRYAKATENLPKATVADVATTIYNAVTDDQPRLRYIIGQDAQFYIDVKQKNTDTDFVKAIRDFFIN